MALTLIQAFEDALKIISRYSQNGTVLPSRMVADMKLKMFTLANNAQQELAKMSKIPAVFEVTVNPIAPVSGSSFSLVSHINTDVVVLETVGGLAYNIDVDSEATIYVEEENPADTWTIVKTISPASTVTSFTNYKGKVTLTSATHNVRIRLAGSYPYTVRNVAMWNVTFKGDANVPAYSPFVTVSLPANFMEMDERIINSDELVLEGTRVKYDRSSKTITVPQNLIGSISIHYFKYPTEINTSTAESYSFELTDAYALSAIPYYMASMMVSETMMDVSSVCMMRYNEIRNIILNSKQQGNAPTMVANAMFGRR